MRNNILLAASINIKKYGFRRFTMDEIAGDLGISKKTLYKYFRSKDQLIGDLIDQALEIEERDLRKTLDECSDWLAKVKGLMTVYSYQNIPYRLLDELARYFPAQHAKIKNLSDKREKIFRQLFSEAVEENRVRADISLDLIVLIMKKLFQDPTDPEILAASNISVNQVLEQMLEVVLYGILKPNAAENEVV